MRILGYRRESAHPQSGHHVHSQQDGGGCYDGRLATPAAWRLWSWLQVQPDTAQLGSGPSFGNGAGKIFLNTGGLALQSER